MTQCPRCETEMNEGETSVQFYDDFSDSTLELTLEAVWCDSCNYFKLSAE